MNITVLYSCSQCGAVERPVEVKARTTEDVVDWMKSLSYVLSRHHDKHSPGCHVTTLTEVKIPATGIDRIGGAPVN